MTAGSFQSRRGFQNRGRWLIEVPPDAPIVCAGTLRLPQKRFFTARTIINVEHSEIHKELAWALELVTQQLPE